MSTSKGPTLAVLPGAKGEASATRPQSAAAERLADAERLCQRHGGGRARRGDRRRRRLGHRTALFRPSFLGQVRQTLANIVAILGEGGAGPEHLVRLTWYVVDVEEYLAESERRSGSVYREVIGAHYPAMAVVQVVRLVEKAARVEIEATAVVPH